MEDVITIFTNLNTKGFEKGSKAMKQAVNSLSRSAQQMGRGIERSAKTAISSVKRLVPMILGVGSAYGIISKAVSAFMQQNEELSSKMNSIWTALGNVLAPILTQIINWVTTAVSYFLEFLRLLGVTGKTASQLSQKANQSAGQLQKTIAGFDELNVLQDNSGGNKGKTLDDVEPSAWMQKLAELFKNKMWDDAADMIIEKMNNIIYTIRDRAEAVGEAIGQYLQGIVHVVARVLDEVDWKQLGVGIANFLNGLLKEVEGINFGEDLGKILVAKFTIAFKIVVGFLETFDFARLGNILSEAIKSAFDAMSRAIDQADPQKIGENLASFFNSIDWDGIADSISNFLMNAWEFATTALLTFIQDTDWQSIGAAIHRFFSNLWENREEIANTIFEMLKEAWHAALDFLWGVIAGDSEVEPPLIGSIRNLGDKVLEFAQTVLPVLIEGVSRAWTEIQPVITTVLDVAGKIIEKVTEFVKEHPETAVDLVKGALKLLIGLQVAGWVEGVIGKFSTLVKLLGGGGAVGGTGAAVGMSAGLAGLIGIISFKLTEMGVNAADSAAGVHQANKAIEEAGDSTYDLAKALQDAQTELNNAQNDFDANTNSLEALAYGLETSAINAEDSRIKTEKYNTILGELANRLGITQTELERQIEAANGNVMEIEALTGVSSDYTNVLSEQESILESQSATVEGLSGAIADEAGAVSDSASVTRDAAEASREASDATKDLSGDTEENKGKFNELQKVVSEASEHMQRDFIEGVTEMGQMASDQTQDIQNVFETNFGFIIENAYWWGQDLIYNFTNGLIEAANSALIPTVEDIMQSIKDYMGFSEPKKGPLSDFHTYAPDMMDLFASGIDDEKNAVLKSVSAVADGVADAFGNTDFSIGANMSALNAIGSNVPFAIPAVAGGGILPYSVGSGSGSPAEGSDSFTAIALQLSDSITNLQNSIENMQWVAQFSDIRAVVKAIRREEKRMDRAGGV